MFIFAEGGNMPDPNGQILEKFQIQNYQGHTKVALGRLDEGRNSRNVRGTRQIVQE